MTDRVDLGALRSTQGYFLTRNAPRGPFVRGAVAETGWRFGSTFRDSATTLRDDVLKMIRTARRKVFVTSFILGDDDLIEELVAAANRLTGGVYVISELSEDSLRRGLERLADMGENVGVKIEAEKKRFVSLSTRGIAVRGHENCHAKFVVVDDERAWVGSANLETRAFTEVGEVGVTTDDPAEVGRIARKFARMWLEGCRYELPASAHTYSVDERDGTPVSFRVPEATNEPAIVWTDERSDRLLRTIHAVIATARRRLVLSSYSLNRMLERHDLLIDPLRTAIDHGVEVELLVRALNNRDRHRADASELHDIGVRLVADDLNHAKAVVADDNRSGALFSANFDLDHGLLAGRGIEVGARLDGTPALDELARYLDHALQHATREFVAYPTARQLHDGLDARWKRPWPLDDRIQVAATTNAWDHLAGSQHPVLWCLTTYGVELIADAHAFRLTPTDGIYQLTAVADDSGSAATLARWWRGRSDNDVRESGGFCPVELSRISRNH